MHLTRLGHACVRLERDGARLVIDPGSYSAPDAVGDADAVLVTHEHADHVVPATLRRDLAARPRLEVWAPAQFPRSTAPPRRCEGHHSEHRFRDQGATGARSGLLVCWHHRDYVHDNGIEITRKPGGGWQFTDHHDASLHR